MYDLIIVGGGPAGITAGIYAARKKLKTLLLAKDFVGQLGKAFDIENYPGFKKIRGVELAERMEEHLKSFEIDIETGKKVSHIEKKENFLVREENGEEFEAKAVILATGRDPRPLEVPGEKEFLGRGVGYCVTCDGPLFSGKKVAVVGGGNSGVEAVLELGDYCKKVYLLELQRELLADELLQEKARSRENVEILLQAKTKRIKGDKMVTSLVYEDLKEDEEKEIELSGVFIEVGYVPATGFAKGLVEFNERDEIKIDVRTNETRTKGLFAAGDATNIREKQIVVACGEGAKAALSAYRRLKN